MDGTKEKDDNLVAAIRNSQVSGTRNSHLPKRQKSFRGWLVLRYATRRILFCLRFGWNTKDIFFFFPPHSFYENHKEEVVGWVMRKMVSWVIRPNVQILLEAALGKKKSSLDIL